MPAAAGNYRINLLAGAQFLLYYFNTRVGNRGGKICPKGEPTGLKRHFRGSADSYAGMVADISG
jgi:hypothetical protein